MASLALQTNFHLESWSLPSRASGIANCGLAHSPHLPQKSRPRRRLFSSGV